MTQAGSRSRLCMPSCISRTETMKQLIWLLLPIGGYALICITLYLLQRTMLYFPTPAVTKANAGVFLLSNGEHLLKIWHVDRASDKALIYFGGNAEDVAGSIASFTELYPDHDLYLANYRGYGGSTGSPSEAALLSDGLALFDAIRNKHGVITVKGRSLGTGVALHLAAERPVDSLILVTPYDSMTRVAGHHYPFLPVSLLLKDRYDSLSMTGQVNIPILVLTAEHDEVIPRSNSDNLTAHLPVSSTTAVTIAGAGHNNVEQFGQYTVAIREFLHHGR